MENLIKTAQDKKYTEFEAQAKEILTKKVATAMQKQGYFDRLNAASGADKVNESILNEKESYKEFMAKKLKKFGVKSPAELEGADKKKFFDEIDAEWDGKDEKPEVGDDK